MVVKAPPVPGSPKRIGRPPRNGIAEDVWADVNTRSLTFLTRAQREGLLAPETDLEWTRRVYYALIGEALHGPGAAQDPDAGNPDALATLTRCDPKQPAALAFLAMTRHQLGQQDQARAALDRLHDLAKAPAWANDADAARVERALRALEVGGIL